MFILLYVLRLLCCFLWYTILYCWRNLLNILNGIRLPSTPELILCVMHVLLLLELDYNLVNMTDFMLWKLRWFIFAESKLLPCWVLFYWLWLIILSNLLHWPVTSQWSLVYLLPPYHTNLHIILKWLGFQHSPQLCHMQGSVSAVFLSHSISNYPLFSVSYGLYCHVLVCYVSTESNSLVCFMLFSATFCTLCYSTPWAHNSSFLLVGSSMSSNVNITLKSSLIMPPSPSPFWIVLLVAYHTPYSHILPPLFIVWPTISGQIYCFFCVVFHIRVILQFHCGHGLNFCLVSRRDFCCSAFLFVFMVECLYKLKTFPNL